MSIKPGELQLQLHLEHNAHFVEAAMEAALPWLMALGALVIVWGVLCAAYRLIRMELRILAGKQYKRDASEIRMHLGFYLILALEFLIAVDIIETLLEPGWEALGILAALVVLRTVMSFSLEWEMKDVEKSLERETEDKKKP